ncbi:LysR family transcriptional regulator [Paracraurococcus lichenis]|uniref:LysR family transcriptional regulator n=1 Tax=Paracraurococcus lichenis TaxID=3064888 RepID=A0ABT9E9M3_9PROT|nr:LysR family transcriptional regulator [Paracraurococcus sp. LOR1-02]MDO9712827.1 LysR family transcriptional regulator [Paracraurococcus sp. LOR1-02]
MNRVRNLEMLVRATEAGSFTAAAATLRVTSSAVSHGIAELERQVGVRLIHRTTRQFRLTDEGQAAYRCGRDILDRLGELDLLAQTSAHPEHLTGTLRIGLSAALNRHLVTPRIGGFLRRHPDLSLEILTQYRPSEMQLAGMDVLLRVEEPEKTRLVARRLGVIRHGLYASPSYVGEAGALEHPEDLLRHRCLVYKPPHLPHLADEWQFERGSERPRVRVPSTVVTDDREGLIAMACRGDGIMRIGMFDPALISSGQLVPLLPGWRLPPGPPVYALYRRTPQLPPRISAFLGFLADAVAEFDPREETLVRSLSGPLAA